MFATDFLFDNNRASDFGLMIGSFDNDTPTATGGDIEYTVVKAPNSNIYDFYGSQLNNVIIWKFSIIKDPCIDEEYYFNQYEESQIAKWLLKNDGYRWFQFDQDGYEDIYYKVYINLTPHQFVRRTIGFDLTVTSNCGYGYSEEIYREYTLNSNKPIPLEIYSDINTYILPHISIIGTGNFFIYNDSDPQNRMELNNINQEVIMDSSNDLISGISSPNDFNWKFLRFVDGKNKIVTNSVKDIKMKIIYREPRRVII